MIFNTMGDNNNPAILFFHAMGVTGASSIPVANYLKEHYFCIMPTSTVYCENQRYISKEDEFKQVEQFLNNYKIKNLEMVVASSIGADLGIYFLTHTKLSINHVFFDGGQFAQINKPLRVIMTPFLYLAIKSLYWSKGKTLKYILWCDDENIKPYFIEAGRNLTYHNLYHQLSDSLENKAFPSLPQDLEKKTFFEFGSVEDHFKYRDNVMKSYKNVRFPIFEGYNHMQYQIKDPKGFADMLMYIIANDDLPNLSFLK